MNNCIKIAVAFLVSAVFAGSLEASAESREHRTDARHEFRLGWGDQMFEKLIWQKPPYIISNLNESYRKTYKENWRYSQHWFAEYSYRVNGWFGVGAMVDASGCVWDDVTRNGLGVETDRQKGLNFWNLTLMPMCRFTWFNSEYVSLYSSLGAGLGINGGSETDADGHHTLCGVAFDLALVGVTVDWDRWCVFTEIGGLTSFKNFKTTVFLLNSRIISVGAGFRF